MVDHADEQANSSSLARKAYRKGLDAVRNKSLDEGLKMFEGGLSLAGKADLANTDPRFVCKLHLQRALCKLLMQSWREASSAAKRALKHNPKETQALFIKALADRMAGDLDSSLLAVKRVCKVVARGSLKYWQARLLMKEIVDAQANDVVNIVSSDGEGGKEAQAETGSTGAGEAAVAESEGGKGGEGFKGGEVSDGEEAHQDSNKRKKKKQRLAGRKRRKAAPTRNGTLTRKEVAQRKQRQYTTQIHKLLTGNRDTLVMDFNGSSVAGQRVTVNLYGMYSSGTHALLKYLEQYFDVALEPITRKKDDGTLWCGGDLKVWKHTVPVDALPAGASQTRDHGPLICIFVWREVRSWLSSLAYHPYELRPTNKARRKQNQVWWMFNEGDVSLCVDSEWGSNPFSGRTWPNPAALWVDYMRGYLEGRFFKGHSYCPPCFYVSHQEILDKPREIYEALKHFGLPLKKDAQGNPLPFEPIQASVHGRGDGHETVDDIRARYRQDDPFTADTKSLEAMRQTLGPHKDLFDQLGIDMP